MALYFQRFVIERVRLLNLAKGFPEALSHLWGFPHLNHVPILFVVRIAGYHIIYENEAMEHLGRTWDTDFPHMYSDCAYAEEDHASPFFYELLLWRAIGIPVQAYYTPIFLEALQRLAKTSRNYLDSRNLVNCITHFL